MSWLDLRQSKSEEFSVQYKTNGLLWLAPLAVSVHPALEAGTFPPGLRRRR